MSQPYIGEIRMFGGNFAPLGWMFCEGQVLSIAENDTLFSLLGTTYGGDGQSTFALPDLRGRVPVHQGTLAGGSSYTIAEAAGLEQVTLTTNQIPAHTHQFQVSSASGTQSTPGGNMLAASSSVALYASHPPATPLNTTSIGPSGGSQPHDNRQPFLCVSFIISLFGIFPSTS